MTIQADGLLAEAIKGFICASLKRVQTMATVNSCQLANSNICTLTPLFLWNVTSCHRSNFLMHVIVVNYMDRDGMVEPIFDYQFRVILLGDSTVGKSSLLKYFTEGRFDEGCEPTVGVDFFARLVEIKPGLRVKLQLWDTAGQERFRYCVFLS